jgi:hypothetical protein
LLYCIALHEQTAKLIGIAPAQISVLWKDQPFQSREELVYFDDTTLQLLSNLVETQCVAWAGREDFSNQ